MDGTPFGRYQLIELLGRGGMGEVWRAYDEATQRTVAVKVLPENLAHDPEFEQRFRREAFAAAGLNDPHVVPIHNFGEIDGRLYVDMRLIKGNDLQALISRGRLEPGRAVNIVEQVASALDEAHRVNLVHRDVKPSNILVSDNDFAYLIDFGIARAAGDTGMTGTGNVIGTWAYLAPERLTGGNVDPRVDIYALACVLHEALTGSQPFPGKSIEQQISGHLTMPPPRPSMMRGDVPAGLDSVVAKGMAKNPTDRYANVLQMAEAARDAVTTPVPTRISGASRPSGPARRQPPPPPARPTQPWASPSGGPPKPPLQPAPPTLQRFADPRFPPQNQPPPRGNESKKSLWYLLAGAVALIAIVAVVAVLASTGGDSSEQASSSVPSPGGGSVDESATEEAAAEEEGPFSGIYDVEFGQPMNLQGVANGNDALDSETWGVRSECPDTGCLARAGRTEGNSQLLAPVFDEVDGTWVAVGTGSGTCWDEPAEYFEVTTLEEQSDGSFTGTVEALYPARCAQKYDITLTRTGDVTESDDVPDPSEIAPRVPSPAEALYGRYHHTRTYVKNGLSTETDYPVRTYCLRTAERCISYFDVPQSGLPLVFSDGQWETNGSWETECDTGGMAQVSLHVEYPLPDNGDDPIQLLTGQGELNMTGTTCLGGEITETFERTGS
ncbi:MAG: protein kinase domain-containing protein [Mycobacterium sp.]